MSALRVLILGASGRLGGMVRRHWRAANVDTLWQYRRAPARVQSVICDPLTDPDHAARRCGRVDVVLDLSGVVPGAGDLALNTELALAALALGARTGAGRVFLASTAAVYGAGAQAFPETAPLRPLSDYGAAKAAMERSAQARAAELGVGLTVLRIGNVAGADALLGPPEGPRVLDRFKDGTGPRRSYIGPLTFAHLLAALVQRAARGADLPELLNIAQPGAVAMSDLCAAAGFAVTWRPAPDTALPLVETDVTRLESLLPVPAASAQGLVAEWRADRGAG